MADYNKSLFISSTFRDMQSERDIMRDEVLPELQSELRLRGFSLDFIDLRWGISTEGSEESASVKIIKTCFDEIKRSKPFFLLFMGDRYGWIPPESDVKTSLEESGGHGIDYRNKSITELEVEFASKLFTDNDHCVFYFRDAIDFPPDTSDEIRKIYTPDDAECAKTAKLKQYLSAKFPHCVYHYAARYDADAQKLVMDGFGDSLIDSLKTMFKDEIGSAPPKDYVETENNLIQSYMQEKLSVFSARKAVIADISALIQSERVLAVTGESGSGKSCIMAKMHETLSAGGQAEVLFLAAGLTENSASIEGAMRILSVNLIERLGLSGQARDEILNCIDPDTLYKQLYNLLYKLSERGKPVYVLVDALDQFTRSEFEKRLKWLNTFALPQNVHVLVSAVPDCDEANEFTARSIRTYPIPYFSDGEIPAVIDAYMRRKNKTLTASTIEKIVQKRDGGVPLCANPLYLSLLLDELLYLGEGDFASIRKLELTGIGGEVAIKTYIEQKIEQAPVRFDDLLLHEIESMKRRLDPEFIDIVLGAVSLSRRGLPESWIEGIYNYILLTEGKQFSVADFSLVRKLLRSHLVQKENGKWDWGHRRIAFALRGYYASNPLLNEKLMTAALAFLKELPVDDPVRRAEEIYYLEQCGFGSEIRKVLLNATDAPDGAQPALQTFEEVVRARVDHGERLSDIFAAQDGKTAFYRMIERLLTEYGLEFRYSEILLLECVRMLAAGERDRMILADAYMRLSLAAEQNNKLSYARNTARIAAALKKERLPKQKKAKQAPKEIVQLEQARQAVAENENTDNLRVLTDSCLAAAETAEDEHAALRYLKDAEDILKRIAYIDGGADAFAAYTAALNQSADYRLRRKLDASEQIEHLKEMRAHEIKQFGVIKDRRIKRFERTTLLTFLALFAVFVAAYTVFIQFGNGFALQFATTYDALFYNYLVPYSIQILAAVFWTVSMFSVYFLCLSEERYSAKRRYWSRSVAVYAAASLLTLGLCFLLGYLFRTARLGFDYRASANGEYAYRELITAMQYLWFCALGTSAVLGVSIAESVKTLKTGRNEKIAAVLVVFAMIAVLFGISFGFYVILYARFGDQILTFPVIVVLAAALYGLAAVFKIGVWIRNAVRSAGRNGHGR